MIYPQNFEEKAGFDKIRALLKDYCYSDLGISFVEKIRFSNRHDYIIKLLEQTNEFKEILMFEESFPNKNYINMEPELNRLRLDGTFIEQGKLLDLKASLTTILEALRFFKNCDPEKYPQLILLSSGIEINEIVLQRLDQIVDDKGYIRDNASSALAEIRHRLKALQSTIDRRMGRLMSQAKNSGWAPENSEITIRNGRLVIPMKAADKRKIKGFVHDESATGQTVFIEPAEIFETNNEIRELENSERREIIRILKDYTELIRPYLDELKKAYRFLGALDFIQAKARFAIDTNGVKPLLNKTPGVYWRKATHPLLYLSHKEQGKEVVPLDLHLNENGRILVISGPNAGGKSVCLKTTALLQYMLQCGLLVPVLENSEFGVFQKIFIDIGDEQSLENDLSTYSSHLMNMKHFVENSNSKTLFLIDEFGTGTEPQLGGAIAEAVLENINDDGAFGVITTHYANLKLLADVHKGIINGAMLYDTKEMRPLYMLKIGNPGSSFAFEIARKIGFPTKVLDNAAQKTGKDQLKFDEQLQQLEVEKEEIRKKQFELKNADKVLNDVVDKYQSLHDKMESRKQAIIQEARQEAREIVADSNALIEKTIREIKEAEADKEKTKEIRQSFEQKRDQIIKTKVKKQKAQKQKEQIEAAAELSADFDPNKPLEEGDNVKVIGQQTIGTIMEIKGNNVVVSYNSIKFKSKLKDLERVSNRDARKQQRTHKTNYSSIMHQINKKMTEFNLKIDVRGQRADEALANVKKYVDEAILLSINEVEILHGKGNGILRDIIREHLRATTEVKGFRDAALDSGGAGITIVRFR
ncbi:MAG: endonuclease MutS2 [Bacteroidales bacterium]